MQNRRFLFLIAIFSLLASCKEPLSKEANNMQNGNLRYDGIVQSDKNVKTEVALDSTKCYLGTLSIGEIKEFTISLTNVGPNIYAVSNIVKSCGCTEISIPKEPIRPQHKYEIRGKFTASEKGIFQKEITLYGNSSKNPLYFIITGIVK